MQEQTSIEEIFPQINDFIIANLKYGPAGYIEIGIMYLALAPRCAEASCAHQKALQHFYTAFLLEPFFENMVYNAYQGGLISILNDKKFYSIAKLYRYRKNTFAAIETVQLAEAEA